MPGDKELRTKLTMQDEATEKLNRFKKNTNSFAKDMNKAFQPIQQYRAMFSKLAFVGSITFGVIAKATRDAADEVKYLDEMAVRLHTTLGSLAKEKYGNINLSNTLAGENVKIGRGQLAAIGDNIKKAWTSLGAGIMNMWGGVTKANRANTIYNDLFRAEEKRLGYGNVTTESALRLQEHAKKMASIQLGFESKQRSGVSNEGLAARVDVQNRIDQLSLGSVALQRKRFEEEIELYRQKGVKETDLAQLHAAFESNINRERNIQFMKMQAEQLKAKGETYAAMEMEDKMALEMFKKHWGDDGEMVEAFKKGLGEIRAQKTIFVQTMKDVAGALSDSLATNMTSMKGFLQDFGNSTATILKQVAAQWMITQTLGRMWSPFNLLGLKFHEGGVIRAHSGLAVDEVPIIAQTGERVLSRRQNREYESIMRGSGAGGNTVIQPVITIRAFDATDILRNKDQIEAILVNSLQKNGAGRKAVKKYG